MTDLPSRREFKVLKALCLDSVENRGQWPGVGAGTEAALVAKGWIVPATCETYGTEGYLMTKAGHEAHEAGWSAGLR
jgi:hypothetical protein